MIIDLHLKKQDSKELVISVGTDKGMYVEVDLKDLVKVHAGDFVSFIAVEPKVKGKKNG